MPWYGFTQYGVPDIPEVTGGVAVGQTFLYPSAGARNAADTAYITAPPVGYLLCNGASVLVSAHQALFDFFAAELGNGYFFGGAGLNFTLPNLSARFPIGLNTVDVDVNTIGKTGGIAGHFHTIAGTHSHNTADHDHTVTDHDHPYVDHFHTSPSHRHGSGSGAGSLVTGSPSNGPNPLFAGSSFSVAGPDHTHGYLSGVSAYDNGSSGVPRQSNGSNRNYTTAITGGSPTAVTTNNTTNGPPSAPTTLDSNGGVDSIPPYYSIHFIIKD